jgi:hypothetical protein
MKLLGTPSTVHGRALAALGLAACLGAWAGAYVTAAGAPTPDAAPAAFQQSEDQLKFTRSGRMLLVYQMAAANANGFALTWRTIKDELTKMNDPALTSFARSLDIQRVETEPNADAIFVFHLNPVSTTYSYHPVTLLFETLKENPDTPGVGLSYDQAMELFTQIEKAQAVSWWLSPIDASARRVTSGSLR